MLRCWDAGLIWSEKNGTSEGGASTSPDTKAGADSTNSDTNVGQGKKGKNVGAIAGGVVGGVVGAALIGGLVAFLIVRKRKKRSHDK